MQNTTVYQSQGNPNDPDEQQGYDEGETGDLEMDIRNQLEKA